MDNKKNTNEEILVPEEDVLYALQFAAEFWGSPYAYTPQLINQRMKDLNMSPIEATSDDILKALKDPKSNEEKLVGYTEWLELNSMLFKRIMGYFANLLSFDLSYVCTNIKKTNEYKSTAYKNDLRIVEQFFDRFDYKKEFKTVMKELLRAEAYFAILREEGEKILLQELPQKFCEITGRFDYGLLFDFDYYWFIQAGIDIDMYPYIMRQTFKKMIGESENQGYVPSAKLNSRTGQFALWHQTSPKDGFTAFKFSPEVATRVPLLSPLMPNIVLEPVIRDLQKNAYVAEATKILFGEVPTLKDNASGQLRDNMSISAPNLGKFLALLKSALPDAIKVAAAPLDNAQAISFESSETIFDSYLKTAAASAGINSRLLYSTDRQNVLETKSSLDVDQNMLRLVYSQFESFLEFNINEKTKKYKFKFKFEGFETNIDREARLKTAMDLAENGIVLEQKISTAIGMDIFDFRRMLEETQSNDFVKKLTPILKSSQIPSDQKQGRPTESDGGLGDSGSDTRSAGSNKEKAEE